MLSKYIAFVLLSIFASKSSTSSPLANFTSMPIISGLLMLVFGAFILIFAIWRKSERRKVSGINEFTCSDRMVNTKSTEKVLRIFALSLILSGFLLITFQALKAQGEDNIEVVSS